MLEDSLTCAKYVYRSGRRTRDKVVAIMLPILIAVMIGMLVWDIIKKSSLVWDIVLLCALIVLQVLNLIMPLTIKQQQKKAYKKQGLGDMDYLHIVIDNTGTCHETLYKDGAEVAKSAHSLRALTSYIEDADRLILVFNKVEFVCLKKDKLTGGLEKLKAFIEKAMQKNSKNKR